MAHFAPRRWPKVAAAAAVLAVAAGGWLAFHDDRPHRTGLDDPTVVEPAVTPTETPSPTPSLTLDAVLGNPKGYVDQGVLATSAVVIERLGPSLAWVGTTEQRVLLVLVATEHPFTFSPGAHVSFIGTVRKAPKGFGRSVGLDAADAAEVEGQGTYVETESYAES